MFSNEFVELAWHTATLLPPASARQLITDLEQVDKSRTRASADNTQSQLRKIAARFPNSSTRHSVERLLTAWQKENLSNGEVTLGELAAALHALVFNQEKLNSGSKLEVVWTGPESKIPVRQTRQVLSQIIQEAQNELLIVSFVVFNIPEILNLLKDAIRRGVEITCIF